jgi:predicted peptidase
LHLSTFAGIMSLTLLPSRKRRNESKGDAMHRSSMLIVGAVLVASAALTGCLRNVETGGPSGVPAVRRLRAKTTGEPSLKYLLYLPADYGRDNRRWPLVLFLHGAGERGDNLDLVQKHGPPKRIAAGEEFPFIVVSPQCPKGSWWTPEATNILLDEVAATYAVDADRVYVTGLSMGGFGTWALAIDQPNRFAAIAPICGMGDTKQAERIQHIPTWVFHGGKDKVVPIKGTRTLRSGMKGLYGSQDMVDALKAAGGKPKLTIYPDAGHDSWTATYDNEKFYEWLLQQRRGK